MERCREIIEKCANSYREQIVKLAPLVNEAANYVPARRKRKLHIGLFGYSRSLEGIKLPRAISFCCAFYSLGIPPEVLGLDALFSQARRRIFTGADFNRTNFTRFAPQAKLIHLATHFFSDEKDPSRSAFLFSASGGNPALCDTRQILSLQLPAELMILSACETSEKDLLGFRLISGMTAAIRRAGVRDMIASLWPVDELSSQVVPLFYRDYLDGNGSAASLRRSKLALMGRTIGLRDGVRLALAHPFIWANYVLYRFCR